jgi:hypothetical protein
MSQAAQRDLPSIPNGDNDEGVFHPISPGGSARTFGRFRRSVPVLWERNSRVQT